MKHLLLLNFFIFSFSVISQIKGHITYSVTVDVFAKGDCYNCNVTPEVEASMAESIYQDSKMNVYFSGNKTRSDLVLGFIRCFNTITDAEMDSMLCFIQEKKVIKTSIIKWSKKNDVDTTLSSIQYETETKMILNYECKKVVHIDKDGNRSVFWYTTNINAKTLGHNYLNFGIPGFPLEMEFIGKDMSMKFTAISFDNKLNKKLFDLKVPKDCFLIKLEDLK
jgi:GLPGLI family protein